MTGHCPRRRSWSATTPTPLRITLEAKAIGRCVYANHAVPGLLQTAEYAGAVFRMRRPMLDEEVIDQRLAARMASQEIFARKPAPLLSFMIEEVVLRKPMGGRGVLRGQLEQILLVGQQRNVEIQVVPTDREDHAAMGGPFTLIETAEGERIAYTEVQEDSRMYTGRHGVEQGARPGLELRRRAGSGRHAGGVGPGSSGWRSTRSTESVHNSWGCRNSPAAAPTPAPVSRHVVRSLLLADHPPGRPAQCAVQGPRAAYEYAAEYARAREQFGKPVIEHQAVAFRLADMRTRIEQSWLMTWRAARRIDAGLDARTEAAMAKLTASESAVWCTWAPVQTVGGWGYSREHPVGQRMRDAKLEEIEEGTSDIMRLIISAGIR